MMMEHMQVMDGIGLIHCVIILTNRGIVYLIQ